MATYTYKNKSYPVDERQFLTDFNSWDETFAEGISRVLGMEQELTKEHWEVLNAIRDAYIEFGRCPIVYEVCRTCGLRLNDLRRLFPAGYLRGACKLAGITYKEGYLHQSYLPTTAEDLNVISVKKTYTVDVRGFLVNPDDWDEYYAAFRAFDMKIPGGRLTAKHWEVIRYLREYYRKNREVPTVYEVCEQNGMDIKTLEELFPDGYHRGAVKIAGLRVR